jgi:hypothetical protein
MRAIISALGAIAIVASCGMAQGQATAPFTFHPAQSFDKGLGELVDVPGAKGDKAVRLRTETNQFGWTDMNLGRAFEKGRYKIELTLCATNDKAAAVALYVGDGHRQEQITPNLTCPAGTTQKIDHCFFATEPFSVLALKKTDTSRTPSTALVEVVLTDLNEREYPRLAGYKALLRHPAPWGLRNKAIEAKLSGTDHFGDVEKWLDQRSRAAELLGRADNLLRAHRLLHCSVSKSAMERAYAALKNFQPNQADFKGFENTLNTFQAELEKAAGGTLDPATGTDIFTWIKFGCEEPTPFYARYGDGVVIRLTKLGDAVDFESSWTTNTYTRADMKVTYSVLVPMSVIDLKTNVLAAEVSGLKKSREMLAEGWFALASKDTLYLFVTNGQIEKVDCSEKSLRVGLHAPAAVAYSRLPLSAEKELAERAKFYQALLLHQPVQCVQVQRGSHIEQVFEYVDRTGQQVIRPLVAAPVPHLVSLGLKPSSKLRVTAKMPIRQGPDGWAYVAEADRIAYDLPELPRAHTRGANVWLDCASSSTYRELRDLGCQSVRLICGANSSWKDTTMEEQKKLLCKNLTWIREAGGIKASIDMHGGWCPPGLGGDKSFGDPTLLREFVARWKTILSWCEPYRDVIGWYDLMNEPQAQWGQGAAAYWDFMRKATGELRPHAGKTPFLVEVICGADPGAVGAWQDLGDANVIVGYHDYWPHMFTHQRVVEPGDPSMPAVYYPAFMPGISWSSPSWRTDSPDWNYWDCWKCNAKSLSVYTILIEKGVRLDCGEYGVVDYVGDTSPMSAAIWLRHSMERFKRLGISHDVYGFHGGFTWGSPLSRGEVLKFWKENR